MTKRSLSTSSTEPDVQNPKKRTRITEDNTGEATRLIRKRSHSPSSTEPDVQNPKKRTRSTTATVVAVTAAATTTAVAAAAAAATAVAENPSAKTKPNKKTVSPAVKPAKEKTADNAVSPVVRISTDAAPAPKIDTSAATPAPTVDTADAASAPTDIVYAAPAPTVDTADTQSDPVVESSPTQYSLAPESYTTQSGRFYLFRSLLADPVPEASSGGDPPESDPVAEFVTTPRPVPDPEPADGLCRKILLHILGFCFTIVLLGVLVNLSLPNDLICEQDQFINTNGQCTDCPWGHVCDGKEFVFNPVPDVKEFLTKTEEWFPLVMQVLSVTHIAMPLPHCVRDIVLGHHRMFATLKLYRWVRKAFPPVATAVSEAEVSAYLDLFPTIPWVPVATVVPKVGPAADVSMASLSLGRVMNTMLFSGDNSAEH